MLPNIKTCENSQSNFSENLRTMAWKLFHAIFQSYHLSVQIDWGLLCARVGIEPQWKHWPFEHVSYFFKKTADILAPRLSMEFRQLLHLGNFSACWRRADVSQIQNSSPSSTIFNYRSISIIPACRQRCFCVSRLVVVHGLWKLEVHFQTPSSYIGLVLWCPFACLTLYRVHWSVYRMLDCSDRRVCSIWQG